MLTVLKLEWKSDTKMVLFCVCAAAAFSLILSPHLSCCSFNHETYHWSVYVFFCFKTHSSWLFIAHFVLERENRAKQQEHV